jgi:membrane carboxypeptidase/penicillin-binding protein
MWMHFMREALRATPESRPERPAGLVDMLVSRATGNQTFACDPEAITEHFLPNTLPEPPGAAERRCTAGEGGATPGGGPLF